MTSRWHSGLAVQQQRCRCCHTLGPSQRPRKHAGGRSLCSNTEHSDMQCQESAPLLDAVLQRGNRLEETPLHVPGHKRGKALDAGMWQLLMPAARTGGAASQQTAHSDHQQQAAHPLRYDLTELAGLDYLSSPSGVIKAAQDLAAVAFKAQQTWFLVNGCSVGIHAAVMATVKPGEALLLARNCHLSAFSACVLSNAVPVWLQPEQDAVHGIVHCVTPEQLQVGFEAAQARGLKVGAVLVVSPTYYGAVARVSELVAVCRQQGVPLLVDEAHGGHLSPMAQDLQRAQHTQPNACATGAAGTAGAEAAGLGAEAGAGAVEAGKLNVESPVSGSTVLLQQVPPSALEAGADLVMHSTHKVLTAMTQAAMLHLNRSSTVNPSRISQALQVLQTSSPSYILLASLDAARRHAFTPGVWHTPVAAAAAARVQLADIPGLGLLQDGGCGAQESVLGFDPLRIVVNVQGLGLTGYDAAAWLEEKHGIVPELSTNKLVVFVFGPGSTPADASNLVSACRQLSSAHASQAIQLHQQDNTHPPAAPNHTHRNPSTSTPTSSTTTSTGSSTAGQQPQEHLPPPDSSACTADVSAQTHQHTSTPNSGALTAGIAALTPREAFFADTEVVPLHAAVGRMSAELLCPYPPGVPVVFPGEEFSTSSIRVLQDTVAGGGVVTGGQDSTLQTVRVVVQHS